NVPVILGASQSWINGSSSLITVNGAVSGTALSGGTQTLTLSNTSNGATAIVGSIGDGTGGGMLALSVNSVGSGGVTLSASNTYSGATTLTAGSLTLGNANALGAGVLAVNGGTMNLAGFNVSLP